MTQIGWLVLTLLALSAPTVGQTERVEIASGARVRLQLESEPATWLSGTLVTLNADRLVLTRRGVQREITRASIVRIETRPRTRFWLGSAIGAGTTLALSVALVDSPGSSDVVGAMAVGALVGGAWGTGTNAGRFGAIGLVAGAATGAVIFGSVGGACESGAARGCDAIIGGALVGIVGLLAGTVIGTVIPNWKTIPLDGLVLGTSGIGGSVGLRVPL